MRVAFVNFDDGNGGAANAAKRVAEALSRHEKVSIDFYVALKKGTSKSVFQLGGSSRMAYFRNYLKFILERLYFLFFERSKAVRFSFSPAVSGLDLEKYIDFAAYDLIHLNWVNFGLLSLDTLESLVKSEVKIIWTLHDMWAFTGGCHYSLGCEQFKSICLSCDNYLNKTSKEKLAIHIQERKKKIISNSPNLTFVTSSKWLQREAKSSTVIGQKEVFQVETCVSEQEFFPVPMSQAKKEMGLDEEKAYILFLSEKVADKRKGFSYLLEAINLLKGKLENSSLLIIGGKAGEVELPIPTIYLGHIADKQKLNLVYNSASVFVIPSLQDNLPNTIIEAYFTGTPVVGFRHSGIEEMIQHKNTGYLVDFKSSEDLAKGILWVLENSNLSDNCLEMARKNYDSKVVASKYYQVYKKALRT